MTHPFKSQAKSGQELAKSRYADGGVVKPTEQDRASDTAARNTKSEKDE